MANPYQKKDALKRDIELKGINAKRKSLFAPLNAILNNNLNSYLVKSELTSSSKNLCLEATFNTPGEGFIADVKAYVLDITDRQVVCQTPQDKDDTIIFSIIEEKAKSLTAPKKKSLNEFFETRYPEGFQGYKPKPTPEIPTKEIVAPSNLNSNLQNTTTEMEDLKSPDNKRGRKPAEAPSEEQLKELTTLLSEVQKDIKKAGFKSGKHYNNVILNTVQRIVVVNAKSHPDAVLIADTLKVLGCDVDPAKEGKQSVRVKGKILSEEKSEGQSPETTSEPGKTIFGTNPALGSENDGNKEEVVEEQQPLFPIPYQINSGVEANKLFNEFKDLLDDYAKRGAEIIRLQEKLVVAESKAPGLTENEMLILGGKLHDLIVVSEMPTLFSKELFLEKLFSKVLMENQK
jgi:hypothetical protein